MTEEVAEGLFDLEEPVRDAADIVQAIRMLGSSEEVSEDHRGPIITLARLALDKLEWVARERTRAFLPCSWPSDPASKTTPPGWKYTVPAAPKIPNPDKPAH